MLAPALQIAGLVLITVACLSVSLVLGAAVGGFGLLLIGLALESTPTRKVRP